MEEKRKLAVTPKGYDDIGKVLERMGTGYEYTPIEWEDLCEIERLCQFEVVFINCSGECESYAAIQLFCSRWNDSEIHALLARKRRKSVI